MQGLIALILIQADEQPIRSDTQPVAFLQTHRSEVPEAHEAVIEKCVSTAIDGAKAVFNQSNFTVHGLNTSLSINQLPSSVLATDGASVSIELVVSCYAVLQLFEIADAEHQGVHERPPIRTIGL